MKAVSFRGTRRFPAEVWVCPGSSFTIRANQTPDIGQVHPSLEVSKICRFKSSGKGDGPTAALDALMQRAQCSFKKGFLC